MANSIEPCTPETILSVNNGKITEGQASPNSTIDCITSDMTHVIACIDVVDSSRRHLLQLKNLPPLSQRMVTIATAGHVEHCDDLVGEEVGNFLTLDYLKEEASREAEEELGLGLSKYLGITPENLEFDRMAYDNELCADTMNHLMVIFTRKVAILYDSIIQILFHENEEVNAVRVYEPFELEQALNSPESPDNPIFFYPPIKVIINNWLLNS